ncbi:MAG TPA: DUF2520 domain-containing protein [Pelobium sp.]
MRVAMLGSGNVASHLSKALIRSGNPVLQVWSKTHQNAIKLALEIGADSIVDLKEISNDVDLVIIAVADDAIAAVANLIQRKDWLVVHTSGSTECAVLNQHPKYGVLYPLQTFSKDVELDFSQVPLCIEANNKETENSLLQLGSTLSTNVRVINSLSRLNLHVAAVFACNFTNYLFSLSQNLLEKNDLSFDIIRPLIFETVKKIESNLPADVQTGPAVRNDRKTMQKHLERLQNEPEWQDLYRLISQSIVKKYQGS